MANPINKLTDTATTEAATADLESHVYGVEVDVLDIIAKRIGKVSKDTTPSDVAQMVADDMPKINKLLRDAGVSSAEFIESLFDEMAELNDEWAKEYYEAAGVTQAKVTEDAALAAALKAGKATVEAGVVSVCDSSVAFIFAPDGSLRPISEAYRQAVNEVVRAMIAGEVSKAKAVQDAVARLAESGVRVQYGSGQTRELYSAVRQNVQQGYRDTMQSLRNEQGMKFGADGVEVSAHGMCAPDHQHMQGRQFTNAEFKKQNDALKRKIGEHNCVVGSTLVCGPDCTAAYRRPYSGKLVRIRTAGGHDLTVTPNHPILTSHGWVSAESIAKGDNVFCRCSADGLLFSVRPDNDNRIPAIKDKFESLSDMFECVTFPSCSEDFHGDGIVDEKIDVVFTDRELRNSLCPHIGKFFEKPNFANAIVANSFRLLGLSALAKRFVRSRHASYGIMGLSRPLASLLRRKSGHGGPSRIASALRRNSNVFEPIDDGHFANANDVSDLALRNSRVVKLEDTIVVRVDSNTVDVISEFPEPATNDFCGTSDDSGNGTTVKTFFVKLDDVVDVDIYSGACHVYNLSTVDGWYFANDILTHNCGHMTFPIIMGVSSNAYTKKEREEMIRSSERKVRYTDASGNRKECTAYEFTQVQRRMETQIRKMRAEASLLRSAGQADAARKIDALADQMTDDYKRVSRQTKIRTRMERTGETVDE